MTHTHTHQHSTTSLFNPDTGDAKAFVLDFSFDSTIPRFATLSTTRVHDDVNDEENANFM
jgi:hypothetical protein